MTAPVLNAKPPRPALLSASLVEALITHDLSAPVAVVDLELCLVYTNAAYARWFQRTPGEMAGQSLLTLYGPDHMAPLQAHLDRVLQGEVVHYQRQVPDALGVPSWHNISLSPWHDEEGNVIGIVNVALRVHELKVTADALRVANQRLASHMENSPLGVLEMDADLTLLHCSSRASQWFGWSLDQVRGRALPELLQQSQAQGPLDAALKRLRSGQELQNRAELTLVQHDGAILHTVWFNSAMTQPQGQVDSIMSQVENVTERVMAARQLWPQAPQSPPDSIASLLDRSDFLAKICATLQLTPAEARVAVLLTEGHPLKRIAQMTDLSIHTVRSQVKSALAKQNLHRQVDLVRRVMSVR